MLILEEYCFFFVRTFAVVKTRSQLEIYDSTNASTSLSRFTRQFGGQTVVLKPVNTCCTSLNGSALALKRIMNALIYCLRAQSAPCRCSLLREMQQTRGAVQA